MEARKANEYLVMKGRGNRSDCVQVMRKLSSHLETLHQRNERVSYWLRLLEAQEDAVDEMLPNTLTEPLIQNKFPVLYLNITYDIEDLDTLDLSPLENEYDMRLLNPE